MHQLRGALRYDEVGVGHPDSQVVCLKRTRLMPGSVQHHADSVGPSEYITGRKMARRYPLPRTRIRSRQHTLANL